MPTTILTQGRVKWTYILRPDADDMRLLHARNPTFHPLNLADCQNETEFPKLDHHDDYVFLVAHIPVWNHERMLCPVEVDIFIAKGTLVTVVNEELKPLAELFARAQEDPDARAELMSRGASPLLYNILDRLFAEIFPIVRELDKKLRSVEDRLFTDETPQLLNEIAVIRRAVIALRRILNPQRDVLDRLEKGSWSFIHEDLDLYWKNISDRLAQLCALLNEHAEVVSGLAETVDTLASHRIDRVVQVLTVVTVMTLPLTLLSTIFSMNLPLPFESHPLAFFGVVAFAILVTLGLLLYLRLRRWI